MYEIKEFNNSYNKKVNEFIISVYVEEFGFEEHRQEILLEQNNTYQQNGGNFWIVVDENEQIIGTIAVEKEDNNIAVLKRLYLNSNYRKCGIASELFNRVLDFCYQNDIKKIVLGTYVKLEDAVNFYIKKGFREVKKIVEDTEVMFFEKELL